MAAKNINDLNDHCLIQIFKHLDTSDWMTLCVTTKRFREIVINHVAPQGLVVLDDDPRDDARIFKTFGKTMTKILHVEGDLEDFLRLLLYYGTPGNLTNIELRDGYNFADTRIDEGLVARAAKYLENVNTLRCCNMTSINEWFTSIPTHQILSLHLELKNSNEFISNPDSFPNLLKCTILLDRRLKNDTRFNALINFIEKKTNLKQFHYSGFQSELVFKTVAQNCANITTLGIIEIKCDGEASRWNVLRQCEHLDTIAIRVDVFNHQEFSNIVDVIYTLRKVKTLYINFENNDRIQCDAFCNEMMSFVKWSNGREKIEVSEYMQLYLDVDIAVDLADQLCYILSTTFNVKTLILERYEAPKQGLRCLSSMVRNWHSFENLYLFGDDIYEQQTPMTVWSNLMMEKISVNNEFRISKPLTIYVNEECEEELKTILGSLYDPRIIALAPHSKSARQPNQLWLAML